MSYRGIEADQAAVGRRQACPYATDLSRWSLEVDEGRQVWKFLEDGSPRQNPIAAAYHVGEDCTKILPDFPKPTSIPEALHNAVSFFSKLQTEDGHWAGDYGGPMFLLPGFAIVMHITGLPVPDAHRREIIRYLTNMQTPDGGWGIHIESNATVFGTALNYVVMRLMGVSREDERMERARNWLQPKGGCLGIPSWGKFWLANDPLSKFTGPISDIVVQLREELIFEDFSTVNWHKARNTIADCDLYTPHSWLLDTFFSVVNQYEKIAPSFLREKALNWCYEVLQSEDEFTSYIDIGPVNKMINMLCVFVREGRDSPKFRKHVDRVPDYFWMGRDGYKMNGTNGSQLWDTSFMVQALIESGCRDDFADVFRKANNYVDLSQIRVNHPNHMRYYRDETKGGWPFSTRAMGWIVADCTGEGLKAALICKHNGYTDTPLSDERIFDAINILLLMQNDTGGYATCEKTRGWHFFEYFNASEVFGEIMIDYDYVECTSSALQALCLFAKLYPQHRKAEVQSAIEKAKDFILSIQLADGSWEGMWGICFTYGTWFGLEGLIDAGLSPRHPRVQQACEFLLSKQKEDGGWGETFMSCVNREYAQHPQSQVVNTAWALLTLLKAKHPNQTAIRKGVLMLIERQCANGDWKQESISGVFNKNCMISYSNFKNIFPIWAIGRYIETYPDDDIPLH